VHYSLFAMRASHRTLAFAFVKAFIKVANEREE